MKKKITGAAEKNTVVSAIEQLKCGDSLRMLFTKEQDELYMTLHQDCRLYVGNSGVETRCLGDIRSIDLKAAAEIIKSLPGNRDYGAFYDIDELPAAEDLIKVLKHLPQDAVYGDFPSTIYRGLAELNIPTKIIN